MIITITLVVAALFALAFFAWVAKGHAFAGSDPAEVALQLRPVDIEAFRNLVDPDEEDYLRRHLSAPDFRKIQRERLRAAIEYISCAAYNAAILLRMGETARRSIYPDIAEAGEGLVDSAIRLRLAALQAMARLYLAMVIPGARLSPERVAEGYEHMSMLVVRLGRLQSPARGVSLAL